MFCPKCGNEVKEDLKFCPSCGYKVKKDSNDGTIVFERKKQFYGVLVPIKIFLDGNLVGSLKAGEKLEVQTTVGVHKLAFNLWSGNGQYDLNISDVNPNIRVLFELQMGLVTSKPKIISIDNID